MNKNGILKIMLLLMITLLLANCENHMSRLYLFIKVKTIYNNNKEEFDKISKFFSKITSSTSIQYDFKNNIAKLHYNDSVRTFKDIRNIKDSFEQKDYFIDIVNFMKRNRIDSIYGDSCTVLLDFEERTYPCSDLIYECNIDTNSVMFKDEKSNILKDEAWVLLLGNKWYLRSRGCGPMGF